MDKLPHGNTGNNLWCWVVNYKTKKKRKILKSELDYWIKLGWIKGGPATKFPIGKRIIESYNV